jgi:hypothetical protein
LTHNFPTSPAKEGEQRKFINPTPGYIGANIFGGDGKPTAIAVEPGGEVWLTPAEERMTAEAPRLASDNPFVKQWDEPVEWDQQTGEATRTVTREGVLVLADEPPRPIASDRFIPERGSADDLRATREAMEGLAQAPEGTTDGDGNEITHVEAADTEEPGESQESEETVTGAPEVEEQPPVEGQPAGPDEVVGTPEAKAANDEALSARESTDEQKTVPKPTGAISA